MPVDGLTLSAAATYTDTEVKDFVGYNSLAEQENFSGSQFPPTPEWQGTAMAQYEWSVGNSLRALVSADVSYSDDFISDFEGPNGLPDPVFEVEGATLYGARAALLSNDDRWRVSVWGRNLTDEFQPLNTRKITDAVVRFTGMPRTYGVSVTYNCF